MTDNLQELAKIAKFINIDKIITPDDIEQIFLGITKIIADFKVANDTLNKDTKEEANKLFTKVEDIIDVLKQKVEAQLTDTKNSVSNEVRKQLTDTLNEVKKLAEDVKLAVPKDGKDANPEDVVPLVLEKIKLPEYEKFILEDKGQQIVDLINGLPINPDNQIDASHIKNLPQSEGRIVAAGSKTKVFYHDLSAECDGVTKTFRLPRNFGVIGVFSTQAPIIYRPIIDWTEGDRTLTLTSQVSAPETGQTLWVQLIK